MIDPLSPDYTNTPVSPRRPHFHYVPADPLARPLVTIVTPFYNTGAVFHETATSVLGQSFQQWEWLIINDGSTDFGSLSVLQGYRDADPRVRVIDHPANRGLSAARNTGFRAAQTEYVVQLDGDDLLEPTAIEKWLWFMESYPEYGFVKGYTVGFGAQEYLWQKGFHNRRGFLEENLVASTSIVRKIVHEAAGGYDEGKRDGLEDWDFWLRCANSGHWGHTVPEYLDWYRRRLSHRERWANWDGADRQRRFRLELRRRYARLWADGFPEPEGHWHTPNAAVPDTLPCENRLRKDKPRLLMIVPWLTMGGADKFNLDLVRHLTGRGWEITIATTLRGDNPWLPHFARYTPDIFILHHFLHPVDHPRFLRYLIQSRQVDLVLVSNSELGYQMLPYLRAHHPDVTFVDLSHMEEEQWKNGGYPRMAVQYQELLDLSIVVSAHLKNWMVHRGGDAARIRVRHVNVDSEQWRPDSRLRAMVRASLGLPDNVPLILYAGRLCLQKQPSVFAKAILWLARKTPDFLALVAGDGPDLPWLRSFVEGHGLNERVRLLGAVPNERVRDLMAASDIFFLPSLWEGIALSIYEAMASGLAVVGADVGGQRELVTPECGVLIPRSDVETEAQQYAEVLAELLRDPERRRAMGQAGRARVSSHFRLDQMGENMVHLLNEASRLHASHPRPTPSLGLGRACAAEAVEYARLSQLANELWAERERAALACDGGNGRLIDPDAVRWRTLVYYTITRFPLPYYWRVIKGKVRLLLGSRATDTT